MKRKINLIWLAIILGVSIVGCKNHDAELHKQSEEENIIQTDENIMQEKEHTIDVSDGVIEESSMSKTEITLLDKEQKDLQVLISMLTLNSYHFGEEEDGNGYGEEIDHNALMIVWKN